MNTRKHMKILFEGWNRFISEADENPPTSSFKIGADIDVKDSKQVQEFQKNLDRFVFSVFDKDALSGVDPVTDLRKKVIQKRNFIKKWLKDKGLSFPENHIIVTPRVGKTDDGIYRVPKREDMARGSSKRSFEIAGILDDHPDVNVFKIYDSKTNEMSSIYKGIINYKVNEDPELGEEILQTKESLQGLMGKGKAKQSKLLKTKYETLLQQIKDKVDIQAFQIKDAQEHEYREDNIVPLGDPSIYKGGKSAADESIYSTERIINSLVNLVRDTFLVNTGANIEKIAKNGQSVSLALRDLLIQKFPEIYNIIILGTTLKTPNGTPRIRLKVDWSLSEEELSDESFIGALRSIKGSERDLTREEVRNDINLLSNERKNILRVLPTAISEVNALGNRIGYKYRVSLDNTEQEDTSAEEESSEAEQGTTKKTKQKPVRIFNFDGTLAEETVELADSGFWPLFMTRPAKERYEMLLIKSMRTKWPAKSTLMHHGGGGYKNTYILASASSVGKHTLDELLRYMRTGDKPLQNVYELITQKGEKSDEEDYVGRHGSGMQNIEGVDFTFEEFLQFRSTIPSNYAEVVASLGYETFTPEQRRERDAAKRKAAAEDRAKRAAAQAEKKSSNKLQNEINSFVPVSGNPFSKDFLNKLREHDESENQKDAIVFNLRDFFVKKVDLYEKYLEAADRFEQILKPEQKDKFIKIKEQFKNMYAPLRDQAKILASELSDEEEYIGPDDYSEDERDEESDEDYLDPEEKAWAQRQSDERSRAAAARARKLSESLSIRRLVFVRR